MKTKEELNELKEEIKALNEKLSVLTEEELEQVTGGIAYSGQKVMRFTEKVLTGNGQIILGFNGKYLNSTENTQITET